jgi:circadian clock protein KaiC
MIYIAICREESERPGLAAGFSFCRGGEEAAEGGLRRVAPTERAGTMPRKIPRVQTGIEGLDDLLCGGFLEGDMVLLAGAPGTGKTSLGMQFLHGGITEHDEPGVFITFEEFPQRIYRDACNFGWNFPRLERENRLKVIFTSPELVQQDLLHEQGIISEMIHEIGARRAVVDSISHFQYHPSLHGDRREAIYGLMNALKREGLTSILIRELPCEEEVGSAAEDFLADGLIVLTQERVEGQRMRFAEVMKSRGTPHIPVRGMLLIEEKGLSVIPAHRKAFFCFEEAISTGISRLDDLLGGGIPYSSFYLLENGSDFHQQLLEANFLKEAIEAGDIWVQVGSISAPGREVCKHLAGLGVSASLLEERIKHGKVRIIGPVGSANGPASVSADNVVNILEEIFLHLKERQKVRLQIDLSSLAVSLGLRDLLALLSRLLEISTCYGGVALGLIQPHLVGEETLGKVRSLADGIVRIWKQGDFDYLQVLKTVNSVRTRVQTILEIPEPPYLRIVS